MKILQDGTIRLASNERRVANYIIKNDETQMKVCDINRTFHFSLSKRMPSGIWLHNAYLLGDKGADSVKTYVATLFSVLSPAPDDGYIQDLITAARETLSRHPDWYGASEVPEEGKSDEDIIREERELAEFVEKVKDVPDGDGPR